MSFDPNKKLDSAHLTKGERAYLKEQGIKPDEFDRLDARAQNEWKDEMKNPSYEDMREFEKKKGSDWAAAKFKKLTT